MFGRRSKRELEAENEVLKKRCERLLAENGLHLEYIRNQQGLIETKDREYERLKAEYRGQWEKLKTWEQRYKNLDEKYQQFLLLPDCSTCAGNFTKVCTCLPGPDEPVRINCPHYTKAEVGL